MKLLPGSDLDIVLTRDLAGNSVSATLTQLTTTNVTANAGVFVPVDASSNGASIVANVGNSALVPCALTPYSNANAGSLYYAQPVAPALITSMNAFAWGTANTTMDAWVFVEKYPRYSGTGVWCKGALLGCRAPFSNVADWGFGVDDAGFLSFAYYSSSGIFVANTLTNVATNQWTHVAMSHEFSGSKIRLFINGILQSISANGVVVTTATRTGTPLASNVFCVGQHANAAFCGYVTDARIISNGVAWTSSFSVPSDTTSNVSGTRLLLRASRSSSTASQGTMDSRGIVTDGWVTANSIAANTGLFSTLASPTMVCNVAGVFLPSFVCATPTITSKLTMTTTGTAGGNGIVYSNTSYQGALTERRGTSVDRYGIGVFANGSDMVTRVYGSGSLGTAKVSMGFATGETTFVEALVATRNSGNANSVTSNVGINTVNPVAALQVVGNVRVDGSFLATGDVTAFSDRRLKCNFSTIGNALAKLEGLVGYTFDRVDMPGRFAGLVAQDVQTVLPEAVSSTSSGTDAGLLSISSAGVLALVVEALKELRQELHMGRI